MNSKSLQQHGNTGSGGGTKDTGANHSGSSTRGRGCGRGVGGVRTVGVVGSGNGRDGGQGEADSLELHDNE
ncbi:hypothetical protein OXX79_002954 [Metschnikowia pulcherrima]